MALSFRYWVDPNYPSVSTEDPIPDCSISSRPKSTGSRIRNCLKKAKQLVSTRSAFLASLFRRGKATEFVSPAVQTDPPPKCQASSGSGACEPKTQRLSFDFIPIAETLEEFSSPTEASLRCDAVESDTLCFAPHSPAASGSSESSSTGSSSPDEDYTPLAFYFDDMNSPSDEEDFRGGGTEKTVRFTVTPPGWTGDSAKLEPEFFRPAKTKNMTRADDREDCKMEQRVWENGRSIEEEAEFLRYYLTKVYKEPEAMMASVADGRLAEWNRLLAGSRNIEEIQTRRRDYINGRRRNYPYCFSVLVQE